MAIALVVARFSGGIFASYRLPSPVPHGLAGPPALLSPP
jgi:hypothetical protein